MYNSLSIYNLLWSFVHDPTLKLHDNYVHAYFVNHRIHSYSFSVFVFKNAFVVTAAVYEFICCWWSIKELSKTSLHKISDKFSFSTMSVQSPQFQGLCSMKSSSETLQNWPYFIYTKTQKVAFSIFHFVLLYIFPYECPCLYQHRPGHSLGKK